MHRCIAFVAGLVLPLKMQLVNLLKRIRLELVLGHGIHPLFRTAALLFPDIQLRASTMLQ